MLKEKGRLLPGPAACGRSAAAPLDCMLASPTMHGGRPVATAPEYRSPPPVPAGIGMACPNPEPMATGASAK